MFNKERNNETIAKRLILGMFTLLINNGVARADAVQGLKDMFNNANIKQPASDKELEDGYNAAKAYQDKLESRGVKIPNDNDKDHTLTASSENLGNE